MKSKQQNKSTSPAHTVILLGIEESIGHKNGGLEIWQIHWMDIQTAAVYVTDIDSTFKNFRYWRALVNTREPWGVYTGIRLIPRYGSQGYTVASADYPVRRIHPLTATETDEMAEILLREQLPVEPRTQFHRLFE